MSYRLLGLLAACEALRTMPRMAVGPPKTLAILGGSGYVGREVAKRAVARGWTVTSLSRRGENPLPGDDALSRVTWIAGDATDATCVAKFLDGADAVAHCVGLLFDVDSGLANFSPVVSGSNSVPGEASTYDRITRLTAFHAIDAAAKGGFSFGPRKEKPVAFVSCAEAGWPDVTFGDVVEARLAPEWLRRYLAAKRAVEAKLSATAGLRPVIVRPSLIWSWDKVDVLPLIPVFNLASALGVPFVDRTIRVGALAEAIVAGLADESVSGVQRFEQMDELAAAYAAAG